VEAAPPTSKTPLPPPVGAAGDGEPAVAPVEERPVRTATPPPADVGEPAPRRADSIRPAPRLPTPGPIQRVAPAAPRAREPAVAPSSPFERREAAEPAGASARPRSLGVAPRPAHGAYLSPRMTAVFGGLFGLATITSIIALLIQVAPPKNERAAAASATPVASGSAAAPSIAAVAAAKKKKRTPIPGPWRIAELEKDPSVVVASALMDKRSLIDALADKNVPKAQAYRVLKAFEGDRKFDKSAKKDRFTVAMDRATKKVKAFEYEVSPSEIWQAREDKDGLLQGGKLDLKIAEGEVVSAFYVGKDPVASYQWAGLEDGILQALDEALAGRASAESLEEGSIVKVIGVEETALGLFSRYKRITALEIRPPDPAAKAIRVYWFDGAESHGYFDDRGRQPHGGGWRSPCPGAPITSRFNPKRMHPVLHKIMPHQGTDYGAPTGTPIYSAYKGTVSFVGPAGPTGNFVSVDHANGITTGYAHMSRFAPGIKVGDKVGTHQLLGYVGTTGRSTGPHLHFSAKKDGKFFDAETLQLDGERVMPGPDRPGFLAAKADLDRRLDAIPLPEPPPEKPKAEPVAAAAPSGSAAAGSAGAAPSGSGSAAAGPAPSGSAAAGAPNGFTEQTGDDDDDTGEPIQAPQLAPGAASAAVKKAVDKGDKDKGEK
jgi:murein DD-endopeptidase MepM/ murein hydrolase activator NlpD